MKKEIQKRESEFLIYEDKDGKTVIDVRFEGQDIWLTQDQLALLFGVERAGITQHIRNIFAEGELQEISVGKKFLRTAADGKNYDTKHYNLDMIISLGYRVNSKVATQFRIWATDKLHSYIQKGFTINIDRLKNPDTPFDYFEELEQIIQDIRTSERRFYIKITDIYATSIDRVAMTMQDWIEKLHGFLTLNERTILMDAGKISHVLAKQHAEKEYEAFRIKQAQIPYNTDFEKYIEEMS
jgi:hypothetical protein